jgi:hypothetical protein
MKKILFISMIIAAAAITFAGCKKEDDDDESAKTPLHAASTRTWAFAGLTWSDAIQMPDCNDETFENSETSPQGRSYTSGGKTYYYYNWAYVNANKAKMCPSPWRVPTSSDMDALLEGDANDHANAWGFGGYAYGSSVYLVEKHAYHWNSTGGYHWYGYGDMIDLTLSHGLQVRCVK